MLELQMCLLWQWRVDVREGLGSGPGPETTTQSNLGHGKNIHRDSGNVYFLDMRLKIVNFECSGIRWRNLPGIKVGPYLSQCYISRDSCGIKNAQKGL